ncbi:hypothetical protein Leryth_018245 [Lithospermum erythrorhizon]|uniref:ZF-HD dimerization-type domain-containing protein n=1 Tax=Lithospermum erythrorhizon TaxID=34254 RepID=A0AAV3R0M0_LITER|nr:hypothetical protein Leryth_018245 [Lithospermum erythrorhizon]
MELSNPTNTSITTFKNENQSQTPTKIQQPKPLTFVNGDHHHYAVVVTYKECLKNHAAAMGGLAVDGCGEFMPSTNNNNINPIDLKCAACGCHRNFHRREPPPQNTLPALEYQPHHRHHPPPPPLNLNNDDQSTPSSPSPPPISSSYYHPSPSHMLLPLGGGVFSGSLAIENNNISPVSTNPNSRKRYRTKFTQDQKEKMLEFAEKVGWKFQKKDEDVIMGVCNEIGIHKGVLKVWMHNNKNTLGKKDHNFNIITPSDNVDQIKPSVIPLNGVGLSKNVNSDGNGNGYGGGDEYHHHPQGGGNTTNNNNDGRNLDQLHQLLSSSANGSASS